MFARLASLVLPIVITLTASAIAHAGDADWCAGSYAAGCERDCCVRWPYEWTHAAPRNLCVADCKARAAASTAYNAASSAASTAYEAASSAATTAKNAAKSAASTAYNTASGAASTAYNTASKAASAAYDAAKTAHNTLKATTSAVKQKVADTMSAAADAVCGTSRAKPYCDFFKDAMSCNEASKKVTRTASTAAMDALRRLGSFTSGGLRSEAVAGFSKVLPRLRDALKACWAFVSGGAAIVARAACSTSESLQSACDLISSAARCVRDAAASKKTRPPAVVTALGKLQPFRAGSAVATADVLKRVVKEASAIRKHVATCRAFVDQVKQKTLDAVCGTDAFCGRFVKELQRGGVTTGNWSKNGGAILLAALRAYFPRKTTRSVEVKLSAFGVTVEGLGAEARGSIAFDVKRVEDDRGQKRDTYEATFTDKGGVLLGGALAAKEANKGARGFVGAGKSQGRSVTLRIDASKKGDWKALAMLGFFSAVNGSFAKIKDAVPMGSWLLYPLEKLLTALRKRTPLERAYLRAFALIQGRSCRVCYRIEGLLDVNLFKKELAALNLKAGGEVCFEAAFSREKSKVTLSAEGGVDASGSVGLSLPMDDEKARRRLLDAGSGFKNRLTRFGLDKLLGKAAEVEETLKQLTSLGFELRMTNRISFNGVTFPADGLSCGTLNLLSYLRPKRPHFSASFFVSGSYGDSPAKRFEVQADATGLAAPLLNLAPPLAAGAALLGLAGSTLTVTVRTGSATTHGGELAAGIVGGGATLTTGTAREVWSGSVPTLKFKPATKR